MFGAFSMGIGIWAMHFIGSLALQLSIPISYNPEITFISFIPAIISSSAVLWLINQNEFEVKRLLFSGLLMGLGISAMHYVGMEAMILNAKIFYDKTLFILSIIVAVVIATFALKINFEARHTIHLHYISKTRSLSALIMGLAVSCTHYIAMQAVVFIPFDNPDSYSNGIDIFLLSGIIIVVFLILTITLLVPYSLRYREMTYALKKNEQRLKIAATAFQTHEAILVTDVNGKIIRVNDAFTINMGYTENEVIGKNPSIFKSGKHDTFFYKNFWNSLLNDGRWSGEIWNRRKNGEIFPEWQTVSAVKNEQGIPTHFVSFYSNIMEFKLAEQEIEKLAFYDPLTNLPNRRLFYERLEHELNIAKRYHRAGILFFLDLDRFKLINDSFGHSMGDQLLIETARRLQSILRDSDTAVRLGGDEFIILTNAQDGIHIDLMEQSNIIAEKIINTINTPYLIENIELSVTTSIGITFYTGLDETVDILLKRADAAMYQAKDVGRNTFQFYQQSMQKAADTKLQIEENLFLAIEKNELSLHYQPQLSDTNKIIGAEALIRWDNPNLGTISPVDLIKVAEDTGLIISIGQWTIETVCKQINRWAEQELYIPRIAINITAKQFLQADFVSLLVHTVFEHQVRPDRIILELTERVFLGNIEEIIDKMNVLKKNGFHFSIDDFGTGYSSLTYLKRLPFDQLKIDQILIRDMVNHPSDSEIVKAIIVMARGLEIELIAEGVETEEHLSFLSEFGCHNYQGFYFSKPLPNEELAEYIKHNIINFYKV